MRFRASRRSLFIFFLDVDNADDSVLRHCICEVQRTSALRRRDDEKKIPPDTEACYETVASQEDLYLDTTEEELRADLTSDMTAAERLRRNREKLEVEWEVEIFDDRCK